MKVVFFTQEDPFYVKIFFEEFFSRYPLLDEIKSVVISKPMGKKSAVQLARQMHDFYGTLDFVRVGMRYALKKLKGKRRLRKVADKGIPRTHTVRQLVLFHGIEVLDRSDLNSDGFLELIKRYNADLFISVASPVIFNERLIRLPRLDCINIHNAPLPKYRGMLPNFWQMYHGEKHTGITVHRIETGIDTGDIIEQRFVPRENNATLHDVIIKTKRESARMMVDVIELFRSDTVQYRKMGGPGSYFSFPSREHVKDFLEKGKRLL